MIVCKWLIAACLMRKLHCCGAKVMIVVNKSFHLQLLHSWDGSGLPKIIPIGFFTPPPPCPPPQPSSHHTSSGVYNTFLFPKRTIGFCDKLYLSSLTSSLYIWYTLKSKDQVVHQQVFESAYKQWPMILETTNARRHIYMGNPPKKSCLEPATTLLLLLYYTLWSTKTCVSNSWWDAIYWLHRSTLCI